MKTNRQLEGRDPPFRHGTQQSAVQTPGRKPRPLSFNVHANTEWHSRPAIHRPELFAAKARLRPAHSPNHSQFPAIMRVRRTSATTAQRHRSHMSPLARAADRMQPSSHARSESFASSGVSVATKRLPRRTPAAASVSAASTASTCSASSACCAGDYSCARTFTDQFPPSSRSDPSCHHAAACTTLPAHGHRFPALGAVRVGEQALVSSCPYKGSL